jgi:hypothetical protein
MSLALRRIVWPDGTSRPDDYNIIHEGQTVGRIYRMNSASRELWRWTTERNFSTVARAEQRSGRHPGRCQGGIPGGVGKGQFG